MSFRLTYRHIGTFKGLLFMLAVTVVLGVLIYTNVMVSELRESSRRHLTLKVERFKQLFTQGDDEALENYLGEMSAKDFPLIVADSSGAPTSWSGLPELDELPLDEAQAQAAQYQREWLGKGNEPVAIVIAEYGLTFYFYYGDSDQIQRLRFMPWIEVGVVGTLILIGYFGFVNIKKSEERSVWVGMARETAHQLGTPLMSLYGWMELLRENPENQSLHDEITRDIERLKAVSERFNQIGSQAPLTSLPIRPVIQDAAEYIRPRLPQSPAGGVKIHIDVPNGLEVSINPTLIAWVFENLLKNSIESFHGGGGEISVKAADKRRRIQVDFSDNGSGIPRREVHNVFRPGFTTKKRGWGLGLSLSKRIVEEIHRGKIFVADSKEGRGTTISIALPKSRRLN